MAHDDLQMLRALSEMLTSHGGLIGAAALFLDKNPRHPDAKDVQAFLDSVDNPARPVSETATQGLFALAKTKMPKVLLS